jgi:superfamily II DNA or RNA helicase
MEEYNNKYKINIYERYTDLKKLNKQEFDNNDLWKIFEYYSCIKLSEEYNRPFYEYDDIDPTFKEINNMSRNDTGIDCSDLENSIVQCKLRKHSLTWKECATFFGSQVIFNKELNKPTVRWDNLIITRNDDCTLSENLLERYNFKLFIDRPYNKLELISFCENLIINPPKYQVLNEDFNLRDYQIEAINTIQVNNKNVIINLPTGTGKNIVIIHSFKDNKKYLILVPRIILMEQLKDEIIKHKPKLKSKIQLIGNNNDKFNENKLITICIFNSVHLIENYCSNFEKIYVDEAHHINKPLIYCDDDYLEDNNSKDYNSEDDDLEEDNSEDNNSEDDIKTEDDIKIEEDDSEDELINVKNYTKIIKSLTKYNNNVYLSATIDKIDDFEYYSKDIRTMIDLKYLCDYTIHVPIFTEDPTNKNICEYLLKNYRNIIIYCNSQKEGKLINKLMNDLQLNCSEYIDCNTPKKKRNDIISKYKNGNIPFLVNVRILVEGFDAPITKGVCFLHLPQSKTTLIQIIGRALRLHSLKNIANIILPFSSKEDEKSICNFLKVMAQNDTRIKKSYENKKLGGYINIENTEEDNNENEDEEMNEIEFKYSMIYNSLGILKNGEEIWEMKKNLLFEFCNINKRIPIAKEKYKNNNIGMWLQKQKKKINDKINDIYIKLSENEYIKKSLDKYLINKELNKDKEKLEWEEWKNLLFEFCDINKRMPIQKEQYKKNNIGKWTQNQKIKINNANDEIYIKLSKNEYVKKLLDEYLIKKELNKDKEKFTWDKWKNLLFEFCKINKRIPKQKEEYKNYKLGSWLQDQKKKINNIKSDVYIKLSENEYVKKLLDENLKYKEKNKDKEKLEWNEWIDLLFEFCNINKRVPKHKEEYKKYKLCNWLNHQKIKINNINNEIYIKLSKNEYVKKSFDEYLINKELNKDKERLEWNKLKDLLFEFSNNNKRVPKQKEEYKNNKLCSWLQHQKNKINDKNNNIYIKLSENEYIKKSLDDYLIKKEANKDKKKLEWNESKDLLFEFCNINKRIPMRTEKYTENNIGTWLHISQKYKISDKNNEIYIKLSENIYVKKLLDEYLIKKDENKDKDKKKLEWNE